MTTTPAAHHPSRSVRTRASAAAARLVAVVGPLLAPLLALLLALPLAVRARVPARDAGMSTAEYAVGTVAAVAFAAVLYKVVRSDAVSSALSAIVRGALNVSL